MEPLDHHVAKALADPSSPLEGERGRILFVTGRMRLCGELIRTLSQRGHHCTLAENLDVARAAVARNRFDVMVLHDQLADSDGLSLPALVHKLSPSTKTIVVSEHGTCDAVVQAMRCGAIDFVSLPMGDSEFIRRMQSALLKARVDQQRDQRLFRLKKICRALNTARHEIARQVDALCNELAQAYQEIAEQMNDVAMVSEFRTLLRQELDVEDLLRTALQYLLTKTGPTNAAVFLPDPDHHFGLGAYMNYDCPRESVSTLLDHLCQVICPQMTEESAIISFDDAKEFAQWAGTQIDFLGNSQVVAFSCHYQGECLAVIVLFREKARPFDARIVSVINSLRGIIAEQLAQVIRVHHRSRPSWPNDASGGDPDCDDELGFGFEGGLAA